MDLNDHFHVILRHWWRIALASLLVAAGVGLWRGAADNQYASSALLRVVVQDANGSNPSEDAVAFAGRTYALFARTRPVLREAAARAGRGTTAADMGAAISVDANTPGFLSVRAVTTNPDRAARYATAAANALTTAVKEQETRQRDELLAPSRAQISALAGELERLPTNDPRRTTLQAQYQALVQSTLDLSLKPLDEVDLVASAQANETPISPHPRRDAMLAFLLALVLNSEIVVLISAVSDRFPKDDVSGAVSELTGLPVLGEIPESAPEEVVEAMRSLRTNLVFMEALESIRSIAVLGGETGCGKSFVAVNTAVTVAELDIPVKLVDGDVRHPTLHTYLDMPRSPGLTDAMQHSTSWTQGRAVPNRPGLTFIPAGTEIARDPAGLFASSSFKSEVLSGGVDSAFVIVDTPPLGLFADALAIAGQCDAVLFVLDATRSRRRRVRRSLRLLEQLGIRPVGVVINRSQAERIRGYYRSPERARATSESETVLPLRRQP